MVDKSDAVERQQCVERLLVLVAGRPSAVPPATAHAASQRAVGLVSVPSSTLVRVRGSLTTLFLKNDDKAVFEK